MEDVMESVSANALPDGSSGSDVKTSMSSKSEKPHVKKDKSTDMQTDSSQNGSADANAAEIKDADALSDKKSGKDSTTKKVAKAGAIVSTAHTVVKLSILAQFLAWIKTFLKMLGAIFKAAAASILAPIVNVAKAVCGYVAGKASTLATAVSSYGIGAVGSTIAIVGLVGSGIAGMASSSSSADIVLRDGGLIDCSVAVYAAEENAAEIDENAAMLANAKAAYSFYSVYGASDNVIAGILANWQSECSIDPTGVESVYNERYQVGPRKQAAWDVGFDPNKMMLASGTATLGDWYRNDRGREPPVKCGIGMAQWTGSRCQALLDTAEATGLPWYTMDCQLVFSVTTDSGAGWLNNWFVTFDGSAADAAEEFCRCWERPNDMEGAVTRRRAIAPEWATRILEWDVDADYANSLIELAEIARLESSNDGINDAMDNCQTMREYDNSSIARAAVSYAYLDWHDGVHNNGTPLYQTVHDVVYPGDRYYASCDRGAAVAVRWSGADVTFKAGACRGQYQYCMSSEKWEVVNWNSVDDLRPGDVLICADIHGVSCHTLMYVGNDIIKQIHGEDAPDNLMFVEASYGYMSPGCTPYKARFYDNEPDPIREDPNHMHNFVAFRCVKPDNSTMYDNAADGVATHVDVPWYDYGNSA